MKYYRLICDYDGTGVLSGSDRVLDLYVLSMMGASFEAEGTVYERATMPWDTQKVVGQRKFRRKNLRIATECRFDSKADMRLLESWGLLFGSNWETGIGFDAIQIGTGYTDKTGAGERPLPAAWEPFSANGQQIMIGSRFNKFYGLDVFLETAISGGSFGWQYSNGSFDGWTNFTPDVGGDWDVTEAVTWTDTEVPNWEKSGFTENETEMYWIRCTVTGAASTYPEVRYIKKHRPITCHLMVSDDGSTWDFFGREHSTKTYYPNGWVIGEVIRRQVPGEPNHILGSFMLVEANY